VISCAPTREGEEEEEEEEEYFCGSFESISLSLPSSSPSLVTDEEFNWRRGIRILSLSLSFDLLSSSPYHRF